MAPDFNQAILVDSIPQEYSFVAAQHCECAGCFQVTRQSLLFHADQPYDLLEAACQKCGQERQFLFDIRSFFGK